MSAPAIYAHSFSPPPTVHCNFLDIDEDELDTSDLHPRLLSPFATQKLLLAGEPNPDQDSFSSSPPANASDTLLNRLRHLSPSVADDYGPKPSVATDLAFRLIHDFDFVGEANAYVALSYVCKSNNRNAPQSMTSPVGDLPFGWLRTVDQFPLPTSKAMFLAVLSERRAGEGLWYDQVCITQHDSAEKAVAVGAMDLVYQNARVVLVAMDDVAATDAELKFLQWYTQQYPLSVTTAGAHPAQGMYPPFLQQHEPFRSFADRLLGSTCFERAWCAQEMKLGQTHVFLVPCAGHGEDEVCTIIRFTVDFFRHILVLASELGAVNGPRQALIRTLLHRFQRSSYANEQKQLAPRRPSLMKLNSSPRPVSIVATIAEVFALKASGSPDLPDHLRSLDAHRDKISITLNMAGLPLALKPVNPAKRPLAVDECLHQLLLIALAAGDPVALCTTGYPLRIRNSTTSWLSMPTPIDVPPLHARARLRLPTSSKPMTHGFDATHDFLHLELLFLAQPHRAAPNPNFPAHIHRARDLVDLCIAHQVRAHALWNMWQPANSPRAPTMRNIFIQTLACALDCGANWLLSVTTQLTSGEGSAADGVHVAPGLFDTLFNPQLILQNFILHPGSSSALSTLCHVLSLIIGQGVNWAAGAGEWSHGPLIVTVPSPCSSPSAAVVAGAPSRGSFSGMLTPLSSAASSVVGYPSQQSQQQQQQQQQQQTHQAQQQPQPHVPQGAAGASSGGGGGRALIFAPLLPFQDARRRRPRGPQSLLLRQARAGLDPDAERDAELAAADGFASGRGRQRGTPEMGDEGEERVIWG